jgi:hypothetical protein
MATRGDFITWSRAQTRNFNQLCQAWAWQVANHFGTARKVYGSANQAYRASKIVSKDPAKAPGGAYHYWNLSTYGHVAPGTAPSEVLMATGRAGLTYVNEKAHLALVKVFDYDRAHYLGWSYTNGVNQFKLTVPVPTRPAVAGKKMPAKTATAINGRPGTQGHSNCWIRIQVLASHGGYTGAWDGLLPTPGKSWLGVQTYLHQLGLYEGNLDGDPKKLTYAALQRWAGVKNPTITDRWQNIAPANWRAIGRKLNTL